MSAQALAEGLSVMAGFQTVSFGADLERGKYYDLPAGPGLVVNIGLPTFLGFPLDVSLGQREMNEGNTGADTTYRWLEAGPRFLFGSKSSRVRPDFFFGVGTYDLEIGSLEFDTGAGGYAGFGFEDYTSDNFSGRFQAKGVYWKSDTFNTDAASLNFALTFGYHF
ncbi:MAG: hypothetical protein JSV00_07005 [bacterium]|nr:MAG: hypothetical protein JSV00_07005 [bacterium]